MSSRRSDGVWPPASQVPESVATRAWGRVAVGAPDECWPWTGYVQPNGYGQIQWKHDGRSTGTPAHRAVWIHHTGRQIPEGMAVDHMCRNRVCCNPAHLQLLTLQANSQDNAWARKTHCPQGHPYEGDNVFVTEGGAGRRCRICSREAQRRYDARRRVAR